MDVRLRPLTVADAEAHAAGEDDETVRWLSGGYAPLSRVRAHLARLEANAAAGQGKRGFGICVDGRLGGYLEVDPDVTDGLERGDVNISYSVHPWARGHGVAPRAVLLGCDWLREQGIGDRAAIRVEPANTASVQVAHKAGFRRVRSFVSGSDVDETGTPLQLVLFVRDLA